MHPTLHVEHATIGRPSTKRKLAELMCTLDDLVCEGGMADGTYLRLANQLKAAFEADAAAARDHVFDYIVEQAFARPYSVGDVHDWDLIEDPAFLGALFAHAARHFGGAGNVPKLWLVDFVDAFLADYLFDEALHMLSTVRVRLCLLLSVEHDTLLDVVETRLDEMKVKPEALFPDADSFYGPTAEDLIGQHPGFARWLLRAPSAFSDASVWKLRRWAMELADPWCYRDASWRKAVGLTPLLPCACPSCATSRPASPLPQLLMT